MLERRFAAALTARAQSGVSVRVHLDAAGSLFWYVQSLRQKVQEKQAQLEKEHALEKSDHRKRCTGQQGPPSQRGRKPGYEQAEKRHEIYCEKRNESKE